MSAHHPIQPVERDKNGTIRFKGNAIVRFLLDEGPFDLNDIACKDFTREDREQFAQLIGYSLSGAADLSYMSGEVLSAAQEKFDRGLDETEARNDHLRRMLDDVRAKLAPGVAHLFGIHEDDLKGLP